MFDYFHLYFYLALHAAPWPVFAVLRVFHVIPCAFFVIASRVIPERSGFLSANIAYNNNNACIKMKFRRTNLFTCSLSFFGFSSSFGARGARGCAVFFASCFYRSPCVLSCSRCAGGFFVIFCNTNKNISQYYHLIRLCSSIYSSYKWLTFAFSSPHSVVKQ